MMLLDCAASGSAVAVCCGLSSMQYMQLFAAAMLAILFLQSGLDKVFDWKGNLEWLKGHFAQSPLASMVPTMLLVITCMEVAAGVTSAVAVPMVFLSDLPCWGFTGASLSAASLLMLFFGQRMAKDYAGAGSLIPYFILALGTMYLFSC